MLRTLLIITTCAIWLTGLPGYAQSPLSLIYPFGLPERGVSSVSHSLAGTGVAIENEYLGAFNNPANLGSIKRTVFSSGVGANLLIINADSSKNHQLNAALYSLSLSVPVSRFGTFSLSVKPESSPSVRFLSTRPFDETKVLSSSEENALFLPDSAEIGILRQGSSLSWQVAWGYNLLKRVRLGLAYKRYNYTLKNIVQTRIRGSLSNKLIDSTYQEYHTHALVAGAIVPVKQFSFGLSGEYYFVADAKMKRRVNVTHLDDTLSSSKTFELKPAPSLTFGSAWQINQQWLTAADIRYTLWNRYTDGSSAKDELDNSLTLSAGAQFIPAPNLLTPKLYEITQYRAGIRYSQLPGAEGKEIGFTLAAGLPMQTNGGLLDIIFEFAQRTDSRFPDYHENIVGMKLGINAGRKWYQAGIRSY